MRRDLGILVAVAFACVMATFLAARTAMVAADNARQRAFDDHTTRIANAIEGRLHAYLEVLHGGRGLFEAKGDVGRDDFARYVRALDLEGRYPGTAIVGFIRRMSPGDPALAAMDVYPPGSRPEYDVLQFVQPASAEAAVGFDASTDPIEAEALSEATATGEAAATARMSLPRDPDNEPAFLVALPVFGRSDLAVPTTPEARRVAVSGWVFTALQVKGMVRGILNDIGEPGVTLDIDDVDGNDVVQLYADPNDRDAIAGLASQRIMEVGGRKWRVSFGALVEPDTGVHPYAVLFVGTVMSLLLLGIVRVVTTARERAQALADEMTIDLREREAQLAVARDDALAASRAKGEFLASMSHEIRTPLNAIIGTTDLLVRTTLAPEQRRYVDLCRKAGDHLLALLNNVLDLSKVEAGHLQIERIDVDLSEVVERCSEIMAPRARQQGIELVCRVSPDVPKWVIGDPHRLGQILINLIGNAIKFTHKGAVTVEVERIATGVSSVRLRYSVTDTGIGIPADKIGNLFAQFTQVDAATSRKYGGTGLGLAITKSLVELMGGQIRVESELAKGSRFWFDLETPLSARTDARVALDDDSLQQVNVIGVDDNATNRLILKDTLEQAGAATSLFASGQELLDELQALQRRGQRPDLLIVDSRMPTMDGLDVVGRARELGMDDLPVLMLTSDLADSDGTRARALRIASRLEKPVRPRELLAVIRRIVHGDSQPALGSVDATPGAQRCRLLVAEDNEDNRIIVGAYLENEPVQLDFAEDGVVAVDKAMSGDWDLVLMDMQMPRLDGLEATKEIRRLEAEKGRPRVPIVALTAHAFSEERQKMLDAGCDDFASKPIRRDALLRVIAAHARRRTTTTPAPMAATRVASLPPEPPIVDRRGRIKVTPTGVTAKLAPTYLKKKQAEVGQIRAAAAAGDFEQLRVVGHGLKGSGASYGFQAITELGGRLEAAAKQGDATAVATSIDDLADYLSRVEIVPAEAST